LKERAHYLGFAAVDGMCIAGGVSGQKINLSAIISISFFFGRLEPDRS
jgi:hypothetical protein